MRLYLVLPLAILATPLAAQSTVEAQLDAIFAPFSQPGFPGCALGVAQRGRVLHQRAWGLADLERNTAITPQTIFEAGSVSKQFTAAAVLLLARDGRLSLDDDVRRWIPQLPDYGAIVTLRHMLHHTSGLRDWGSISSIAGWGRDTRAISHGHVLQVISRVRELNFPPGTEYDYSNSNYNLLAMVVERASGMSFPQFTRQRIFEPLGMTSTSWRDDALRVVRGRALSYNRQGQAGEWRSARAIENIFGNCCLLTTVGDLLKWMAHFDSTRLGGPGFREEQETRGVLANGRQISYARGLVVDTWRGQPHVSHGGATAGYRAYTVRYTGPNLAVAVLCNAGTANPEALGDSAAGVFASFVATAPALPVRAQVALEVVSEKAGLYRNMRDNGALRLEVREGRLLAPGGIELIPQSATEFAASRGGNRAVFERRPDGRFNLRLALPNGDTVPIQAADEPDTSGAWRGQYAGSYYSEEADARYVVVDSAGALRVSRAMPEANAVLRPAYRDGFASAAGTIVFTRGANGVVDGFRLTIPRVRNLRFVKRA